MPPSKVTPVSPPVDYMPAEGWLDLAACRGAATSTFFPWQGEPTAPAKAVCASCPVAVDCLVTALDNVEKHGIFGGMSERERRAMRQTWPRRACRYCHKPIPHTPASGVSRPVCDKCAAQVTADDDMRAAQALLRLGLWNMTPREVA
jgi:hypothetical protein